MFANNLDPVFYLARAAAPGMIRHGWGRIISFSIARAEQLAAQPELTAHAIAKTGVLVLTRTLARVLAPHGITVNAISPGFIDSGNPLPAELQSIAQRVPAGYVGTVDDAVSAVRFLVSEEARYVTGSNIQVGGGWGL
jgi:3-oxoacyl-[acyl-carrier protein] reductase